MFSRNGVRASGPSTFDFIQIKSNKCSIKIPMSRAFTDATHKIFYSEPIPFRRFFTWKCMGVTVLFVCSEKSRSHEIATKYKTLCGESAALIDFIRSAK